MCFKDSRTKVSKAIAVQDDLDSAETFAAEPEEILKIDNLIINDQHHHNPEYEGYYIEQQLLERFPVP